MKQEISYSGLHKWLNREYGNPKKCFHCEIKGEYNSRNWSIEWANKTGKYLRDINDWIGLCKKCHYKYDKSKNLIGLKKIMPVSFIGKYDGVKKDFRSLLCKKCSQYMREYDANRKKLKSTIKTN